jgi:putative hydrolase of the HAD superfamily
MVRAIIFDCFGVLTYDGWLPFKKHYFGKDPEKTREATELGRQMNAGLLGYQEFLTQIADMAGVSVAETSRMINDNVPNEELFAYIREKLKPRYKIGMLSNTGRNMLGEIFTPEQIRIFDALGLSYEMGTLKPDARAYQTIARRLGVDSEECVFIDDQERHCTGARDAGMQTILYGDFDQMKTDLERLLKL